MSPGTLIYVGGFELPDGNAAAHRVVANAKILRQLGYNVVLVGIRKSGTTGLIRYPESFDGFECWSVQYPQTKKQWGQYLIGLREIENLLDINAKGLSGIICYNYPALAQWRLFSKCRRLGGKCIADITEWYEAGAGPKLLRIVKAVDTWLRMRITNPHADGIIAISPMIARFYSARNLPVVEIPTLFDTHLLVQTPVLDKITSIKHFIYVGNPFSVGRVNRNKSNVKDRLDVCVKLFQLLAVNGYDFSFDIYGVELAQYLDIYPDDAELLGSAQKKIRFHGCVDNIVARELVAKSDFSIFIRDLSRVTLAGFPTKLSESISVGTPVITNDYENLQQYFNTPGLFLAQRGLEYHCLTDAMALTEGDMHRLKQNTFQSRAFDFRNYVSNMASFLELI